LSRPSDSDSSSEFALAFLVYLDEVWSTVEAEPNQCARNASAKRKGETKIPQNGEWSKKIDGKLSQTVRPHVWYFALQDCGGALPEMTRIEFDIEMRQEDGSEFSAELSGTLALGTAKIFIGSIFGFWFLQACLKARDSTGGKLHSVIKVLSCACFSQYVAWVLHWLHLYAYSKNGTGLRTLDILSEVASMTSQILVTSLSIFIAHGHTILPGIKSPISVLLGAFGIIVLIHMIVVVSGKFRDDASFKFHENEGSTGFWLVILRLMLFAWFVIAMRSSYAGTSQKLLRFLTQFFLASSLHFLAYPALIMVAGLFAPYLRHKVMFVGLFAVQAFALSWYTKMFLTRGEYFEVSCLGGSLLPSSSRSNLCFNDSPESSTPASTPSMSPNVWDKSQ
jgi:hypothetical protein